MLRGNIQLVVLKHLVKAVFGQKYPKTPELIIVTDRHITHLDIRIKQIVETATRSGHVDIYERILKGISVASYDTVFLTEHDVLYPGRYFKDGLVAAARLNNSQIGYNMNAFSANKHGYFKGTTKYYLLSNLVCSKNILQKSMESRIEHIKSGNEIVWAEPGMSWNGFDDRCVPIPYSGKWPAIDIRYGGNYTGMRESENYRAFNLYWGRHKSLWKRLNI